MALQTARHDSRVVGAAVINPEGDDQAVSSYVMSKRYWKTVIFDLKRWVKPLTGKVNYSKMRESLRGLILGRKKASKYTDHAVSNLKELTDRGVDLLHIFSDGDPGLDYLKLVLKGSDIDPLKYDHVKIEIIPHADHTFTALQSQNSTIEIIQNWVQKIANVRSVAISSEIAPSSPSPIH